MTYMYMYQVRKCCGVTISSPIYCYHSGVYARLMTLIHVVEQGVVDCHILSTGGVGDGGIVAQDGYPFQSEGRTPGDEDSGGVDEGHSEVTD